MLVLSRREWLWSARGSVNRGARPRRPSIERAMRTVPRLAECGDVEGLERCRRRLCTGLVDRVGRGKTLLGVECMRIGVEETVRTKGFVCDRRSRLVGSIGVDARRRPGNKGGSRAHRARSVWRRRGRSCSSWSRSKVKEQSRNSRVANRDAGRLQKRLSQVTRPNARRELSLFGVFSFALYLVLIVLLPTTLHHGYFVRSYWQRLRDRCGRHHGRAVNREDEGRRGQDQSPEPPPPHGLLWRAR